MNRPKKVTVGASSYKINWTSIPLVSSGDHCMGTHSSINHTIGMTTDGDIDEQQREQTFLHEIVHAIDSDRSVGLSEDQVGHIGHGFYQYLRDNRLTTNSMKFGEG